MGLFKDIYCADCGKKTNLILRTRLTDGNYLCSTCTARIPKFMLESFYEHYDLENYYSLKQYINYSDTSLRPMFKETNKFHDIHLDAHNRLFYLGYDINEKTVFFHLYCIDDYDITFSAEEFKEGMLGDKVKGKVLFRITNDYPAFHYETVLDYGAQAKAKKVFFGTEVKYENPGGMDDFLLFFQTAYLEDLRILCDSLSDDEDENETDNQLQCAMSLFMIDDLKDCTLEQLKAQRNRLIKTFHPDKSSDNDTKYAQKINAAYEVLKKHLD